jgi:hypothetical protein
VSVLQGICRNQHVPAEGSDEAREPVARVCRREVEPARDRRWDPWLFSAPTAAGAVSSGRTS